MKILSVQEYQNIKSDISTANKEMNDYFTTFNSALEKIQNSDIVNSFYASGPLGKEMEDEMVKLKNALKNYMDIINADANSLIPYTISTVDNQIELLQRKEPTQVYMGKPTTGMPTSVRTEVK